MALYFASDVHLRLDRPERGRRFAGFVDRLGADDRLVIVGDLADFWFASRQSRGDIRGCEGLRSLADFRERGGDLVLLPGNHDTWLGPFYERTLGVPFRAGAIDLDEGGLRIHATHGHLIGARPPWKGVMESRAFLRAFAALPSFVARGLETSLDASNDAGREAIDRKYVALFREHAAGLAPVADLVIFGHVHTPQDLAESPPRLIVLGGWHHRSSYARVEGGRAELVEVRDEDD